MHTPAPVSPSLAQLMKATPMETAFEVEVVKKLLGAMKRRARIGDATYNLLDRAGTLLFVLNLRLGLPDVTPTAADALSAATVADEARVPRHGGPP